MSAAEERRTLERRRMRRFAAAHVAAMLGLFAVALVAGGGFAAPPIPPDLAVRATATELQAASWRPIEESDTALQRDAAAPSAPSPADKPAPWTVGPDGRVRLRGD